VGQDRWPIFRISIRGFAEPLNLSLDGGSILCQSFSAPASKGVLLSGATNQSTASASMPLLAPHISLLNKSSSPRKLSRSSHDQSTFTSLVSNSPLFLPPLTSPRENFARSRHQRTTTWSSLNAKRARCSAKIRSSKCCSVWRWWFLPF
jgi:hypothetical protein